MGSVRMLTVVPATEEISRLQDSERKYYFTAAFDAVTRKRGLLDLFDASARELTPCPAFLGRRTAPRTGDQEPFVFEGPLHPDTAETLRLSTVTQTCDNLTIVGDGIEQSFCYSEFDVRTIRPREEN